MSLERVNRFPEQANRFKANGGEVGMKKDFIVRRSITMVEGKPHVETYSEQELVRCKECKYYPNGDGTTKWLPCMEIITPPGWFCADGERRETE